MDFLEYKLTLSLPDRFPNYKIVGSTINPHSFCVAKEDMVFKSALMSSDILIPDGVGVVWASKFLYNKSICKISGFDMHLHFLLLLQKNGGGRVFYLGSSNKTLSRIVDRINREFPLLDVKVFSPPFKSDFSDEDNTRMINAINEFKPDVLFVGMTAPKQEKWVFFNKSKVSANVICSIGAVFDFYAGTIKRPSKFWIDLGLEWFPRFIKEPRRLWRRNLISTPEFLFNILRLKYFK